MKDYYCKHYSSELPISSKATPKPLGIYVGWVKASDKDRDVLELNGIDTTHATYVEGEKHLFPCLFSEKVARGWGGVN